MQRLSLIASWLHRLRAVVSGEQLFGALENPPSDTDVGSSLLISGWIFSPYGEIERIEATLGSLPLEAPTCAIARPDVARIFPRYAQSLRCGFQARVHLDSDIAGELILTVRATDNAGRGRTFRRTVRVPSRLVERRRTPAERIEQAARAAADASFASQPLPSLSIVIPVFGQIEATEACLRQLQLTIPAGAAVEIIIVDDDSRDETAATLARWLRNDPRIRVLTNETNLGFGESCNRGARAARNEVLVFLNNDTLPQAGWLPALLAPLREWTVGAVGARLLYPDGTLQEAGGVIFNDGSGWNFGKGSADADDPMFTHVRDVDYCSAAALATRRTLFLEQGGFDARFSPAYYEDVDYCFTLRSRFFTVRYQPAAVIVHVEGATAGRDERQGVKAAQATNRQKFVDKWGEALPHHPAPADQLDRESLYRCAVRGRYTRRVLLWGPTLPEWDRECGSKRMFDLLTMFQRDGWAVTFVADSATDGDRYVRVLQQMGVRTFVNITSPTELLANGGFDLAVLHFWFVAERLLPLIRRWSPRTRIVVDSIDLHFLRRSRDPRGAPPDTGEKQRELDTYAAADAVLAVSKTEGDAIRGFLGRANSVYVVPLAESLGMSPVGFADRRGLLFLGNFRHHPNVDALAYLMREIFPKLPRTLLDQHPLSIVGTDLTDDVIERCAARQDGVRLVGWVPDVTPYLERARLMVAPLRYGAGTKGKLVQAAMAGTPSVTTSIGLEGLPLAADHHVLSADDPSAFAAAVVRLAENRVLWERFAREGREVIRATHDYENVRPRFTNVIERLLA